MQELVESNRAFCWLIDVIYVYLIYVSMYGFCAQFIYRYLALNRFVMYIYYFGAVFIDSDSIWIF